MYFLRTSFSWQVDYYLERLSIKLADLFGAFSSFFALLFVVLIFISLLLWLILPFIEISKKNLLQKIYGSLLETEKQLTLLNERLERSNRSIDSSEL
ncbi:MAG: hypothetical protein HZA78_02155 [Candidatus Schekmanbacteria bacterium]|nr:hypothetical protein [Candidatus Schekmanbacteria bacterium]